MIRYSYFRLLTNDTKTSDMTIFSSKSNNPFTVRMVFENCHFCFNTTPIARIIVGFFQIIGFPYAKSVISNTESKTMRIMRCVGYGVYKSSKCWNIMNGFLCIAIVKYNLKSVINNGYSS